MVDSRPEALQLDSRESAVAICSRQGEPSNASCGFLLASGAAIDDWVSEAKRRTGLS